VTNEENFRPQLEKIASEALEQTHKGVMVWRTTDDEDAFLFSGPKSSLIISSELRSVIGGFPKTRYFELRVLNNRGTVVETLRTSASDDLSELLGSLYHAARRIALDIDSVLDTTLKDLQGLKDEPRF
jgi:hypothetical protein